MMRSTSPSLDEFSYSSVAWHKSSNLGAVSFAVRRPSLMQRIELNTRVRELAAKHEFLRAGGESDQLEASLSELLIQKLYVEWGLVEVTGLSIDGCLATPALLVEKGPESLVEEVATAVQEALTLSEAETKNF